MSEMTLRAAAVQMLRERGPMKSKELSDEILSRGLVHSAAKRPENTLSALITVEIKERGADSEFIRVDRGVFGLRALHAGAVTPGAADEDEAEATGQEAKPSDAPERRVRTPLFPLYREVRELLKIWPGRPRKQVTGLRARLSRLWGTPQHNLDWTDPDRWIPARLSGEDKALAEAIWTESGHSVNPRYTYGHWLLAQGYDLIAQDAEGALQLTGRGEDFLKGGAAEAYLDEQEGLNKILALVAEDSPTRAAQLFEGWAEYLGQVSEIRSPSNQKNALRARLHNLADRGLLKKEGRVYSITEAGLSRCPLAALPDEEEPPRARAEEISTLAKELNTAVRQELLEQLLALDPFAFEHLVKRLLEEMGYEQVEVTTRSGDGGVDVIGEIELGITLVREVVQAKRHKRPIQRKDLDALRGSLPRFNAVRGTIITTSKFAKGTREAALEKKSAPISLIDGQKLIELLIEHKLGVRTTRSIELLAVDPSLFSELEAEI